MAEDNFTAISLTPVRKMIATRMTEAKQSIPHFRMTSEVEVDALLALRSRLNEGAGAKLSVNDLIVKASAVALVAVPEVNVQWAGNTIHRFRHADISVVVATDQGLSTPIVREADRKSVRQLSAEIKALAERAARNALRMDEIIGGSFSISNLGMFGVEQFDAIINSPQCAILAVGAALPALRMEHGGAIAVANVVRLTLSIDHRAIDGATAARFLAALKAAIENPAALAPEDAEQSA